MRKRRKRSQGGFTLVELMVSLTLFSFAIAGVLAVAVSMANGYREQRQIVQTESTARGALDFIADAVRMASPAVDESDVTVSAAAAPHLVVGDIEDTESTAIGACPKGAVRVFNNTGLGGSDELEVVFASGAVVTSVGVGGWDSNVDTTMLLADTSNLAVGDHILVTDGLGDAHMTRITAIPAAGQINVTGGGCTISAKSYSQNALVVRVLRARFYIGAFDGISPVLLMDPDGADGAAPVEPLADYVEDFQIAAAVDEDSSGAVDAGEWGFSNGGPTTFTIGRSLRALRITIIARAASGLAGTAANFSRPTLEDHAAGAADVFRRRILTATVDVRNMEGSP